MLSKQLSDPPACTEERSILISPLKPKETVVIDSYLRAKMNLILVLVSILVLCAVIAANPMSGPGELIEVQMLLLYKCLHIVH